MLLNYIKTAFRNLSKNKSFSIINILGFAFSISVCLMILLFVMKEKSYDSYPNADRIYRLVDTENNTSGIDYRAAQIALANFRQIEKACLINVNPREYPITYNNNGYLIKGVMSTDSAFFKMFSIQFIEGDSKNPLKDPMTCILTESAARKIFGKENPIGKSIIYKEKNALFITGVIKDFPENSSIQANIFVSSEKFQMNQWCNGSECKYLYNIYFQLKKNTDAELFARKLNERAELFAEYAKRMGLMPLRDIYLYDSTFEGYTEKGNPDRLKLLINIALIILTLSIINYVNLTAAQQNKRNKETGIRKAVGASRKDMISLFLTESVLVAFISFGIALAFLELFLPHFGGIVDMNISSAPLFSYPIIIMLPLAIFIIGALTGIGPAIIYASFNPAHIFSGGFTKNGKKSYMRNTLTVFSIFGLYVSDI
ncbi:MAG TPA: ABC transporter permease, partial [Ignavibacteriales bacterium]|nr:ABC transporter permease [Ignavibacteriales bacterium]